jgi:ATP-dependent helicase/nuclease subunit B
MANPKVIFLDQPGSLAEQVAGVLLEGMDGNPYDLTSTEVWVPTAGAARRIRHKLAELSAKRGGGVLSPKFSSPMKALMPQGPLASRSDREAAWGLVLQKEPRSSMEHLFPKGEVLEGEQALLGTAGMMCDLCDLLAEGGITPLLPRIPEVCSEDGERWREIAPLYRRYLDELKRHTLWDPNEARIKAWETPPGPTKALVIAAIPDLPEAARRRAAALLEQEIAVTVLVWKPDAESGWGGGFDGWGRPNAQEWIASEIPLQSDQIVMARDPSEEASLALDFLGEAGGDHALVLGDEKLSPSFQGEVLRRGGSPYLPEGESLSKTEPAIVATEWISLRRDRSLRTLRRLLETPRFASWIGALCSLSHERLLAACDAMTLDLLAETLSEKPIPSGGIRDKEIHGDAVRFQEVVLRELSREPADLIAEIWKNDPAEGVEEVLDVCAAFSSILESWPDPEKAREASLVRSLARLKNFGASKEGDLELSGWLEAPWSEARRLLLAGCVEGCLPASTDGHPFLPDQKRRELGIPDNAARRARDAYLLGCLARARKPSEFLCSFSKFGSDGSPSVPSTLLMRCPVEVLPGRVIALFGKSGEVTAPPRREHDWKWRLRLVSHSLTKISVTDFAAYLRCPFRFYLTKVLRCRSHDPEQREMDAMQFGDLVHTVLERYGRETPLLSDRDEIASAVLSGLERELSHRFGTDPSPAVRVQAEAARVRLLSFAAVQADQVAQGWRIHEVERKSSGDLLLGGIPLSAKIDRIEVNGDRIRVLDYKTYSSAKSPEDVHLEPLSRAFLKQAETTFRGKPKAWVDLQLPLYRKIAETLFPGKTIETGYFLLAADPEESDVKHFDLAEDLFASALTCAEAATSAIARGVFWPPGQVPQSWEDPEGIFLEGGRPEECLDQETIAFLKGREVHP